MDSPPSEYGDRNAKSWQDTRADSLDRSSDTPPAPRTPDPVEAPAYGPSSDASRSEYPDMRPQLVRPRLVHCLVTQVDGSGRGSIGISVSNHEQRLTAAFLCDLRSGICDALGEVEPESDTRRRTARRAGGAGGCGMRPKRPGPGVGAALRKPHHLCECSSAHGARVARSDARPGLSMFAPPGDHRRYRPSLDLHRGDGHPRGHLAREMPVLARPLPADLPARGGDPTPGRKPKPRPHPRLRHLPLPLRTPLDRPAGTLPADAPLDGLVLEKPPP